MTRVASLSKRPIPSNFILQKERPVVNKNLFQSLSGAIKDVHEHVMLFRNIDGDNIGRVLPKYLSQWTSEKVKAQGVNVLPKANVEGAILEDYKVALTLNDGQKLMLPRAKSPKILMNYGVVLLLGVVSLIAGSTTGVLISPGYGGLQQQHAQ
ncbi:hypothetical protein DAPPUDRAFT_319562 [Daphnia pulex]|uniref:Uncharacterized protein n=1 Tax=Daphnia pulex TaxID=6669 RepID=E9GM50_DAPPU|nr:hypothetical protein DAPPUDRAFT_319562 [Daphnia pulex]|eukprot:EFX79451.1 hypothetical protein DAPPUDRAFT_319562 [Daphnia pulex]